MKISHLLFEIVHSIGLQNIYFPKKVFDVILFNIGKYYPIFYGKGKRIVSINQIHRKVEM